MAKAAGRVQTTQAGQLKGKLAYMAPEQIRADVVNRQTDVYAASIVLWECLTGQRLYDASNEGALLAMVLEAKAAPPSTVALGPQGAPGALDDEGRRDLVQLDAIVMCGLSKDPARRFATAREMALALESHLRPATAAEIASWVEAAAAPALAKRAQLVATIEREEALLRGVPQPVGASGAIGAGPGVGAALRSLPPAPSSHTAPPRAGAFPSLPPPGAASEISGVSGASQLSKVAFASASGAPPVTRASRGLPLLVVAGSTLFGVCVAGALLALVFSRMHGNAAASETPRASPPPSALAIPAATAPPEPAAAAGAVERRERGLRRAPGRAAIGDAGRADADASSARSVRHVGVRRPGGSRRDHDRRSRRRRRRGARAFPASSPPQRCAACRRHVLSSLHRR